MRKINNPRRDFKRGQKTHRLNFVRPTRGGIRL